MEPVQDLCAAIEGRHAHCASFDHASPGGQHRDTQLGGNDIGEDHTVVLQQINESGSKISTLVAEFTSSEEAPVEAAFSAGFEASKEVPAVGPDAPVLVSAEARSWAKRRSC